MNEIVREFLVETHENLAQLDLDLVTLEKDSGERETVSRVFRTLHTVKGTAGFLGLEKLQAVSHAGENLLSRLRAGELDFNEEMATALLGVVDAIRQMLAAIEATEKEGEGDYTALIDNLERLTREGSKVRAAAPPSPAAAAPIPAPAPPVPPPAASIAAPTIPVPSTSIQVPQATLAGSAPAPAEPADSRSPSAADTSVRVDVGLLDKMMNLVGELVLARNQILQYSSTQEDTSFLGTVQRLNLLTTELQAGVMKTRMQPIGNVSGKFPRIVRDLALACEKQVRLELDGQETELDRTIIEAIRDPLTHIVRNAVDHGIEPPAERVARGKPAEGRLLIHASHEGGQVIIEVADDGRGIDPIRVRDKAIQNGLVSAEQASALSERQLQNLVFLPGFSTTDRVTHFSGRGVGMDVVRTNIEKIGGAVEIESQVGRGTMVRMKIPLTLAIIPALTVTSGGDRYAIPQVSLLELVRLEGEQVRTGVERFHGVPVHRLRGNLLPLVYLDRVLQVESGEIQTEVNIVVVQADERPFGLVVDGIHDTEEIVVKPLQKQLKSLNVYAGATIMGDGTVALILDVAGLARRAGVVSGARERSLAEEEKAGPAAATERHAILLVSSRGGRMAIPLATVARLEEFRRSELERVGGGHVVQYRGEILPLIDVGRLLRGPRGKKRRRRASRGPMRGAVRVVVLSVGDRRVGLIVGQILDVVEAELTTRAPASRPGVSFTTVVQSRVTEFLDVDAVLRMAESAATGVADGRG